jgi:hypothetical protein
LFSVDQNRTAKDRDIVYTKPEKKITAANMPPKIPSFSWFLINFSVFVPNKKPYKLFVFVSEASQKIPGTTTHFALARGAAL